jgi:hypothetical protein
MSNPNTSWETCSLRKYLNGPFLQTFFSERDRARIVPTAIPNPGNMRYAPDKPRRETLDNIFLLSLDEVCKYFGDSTALLNAEAREWRWIDDENNQNRIARTLDKNHWWWTRTSGRDQRWAVNVSFDGVIDPDGLWANHIDGGVRPALWMKIDE